MRPMSIADSKILDKIFLGLNPGESKRIDNCKTYMSLSAERLSTHSFSMAHYYEQNGDLCPDPDMELVKNKLGWFPVAMDQVMGYNRAIIEMDSEGIPIKVYVKRYSELKKFLSMWLKNIKSQQGL